MGKWLKKYEDEGLDIQKKHLGHFLGLYTTEVGNIHQIVFLWGYDSMADREKRRAAMAADPDWQIYVKKLSESGLLEHQQTSLMVPAKFAPPMKK
jgi:hypothetical protein